MFWATVYVSNQCSVFESDRESILKLLSHFIVGFRYAVIFTTRRHASAVIIVSVRPSVTSQFSRLLVRWPGTHCRILSDTHQAAQTLDVSLRR